jgi:hypothetical protein
MKASDWDNVAKCANARATEATFSWDCEDTALVGDLATREMALKQSYREVLISAISSSLFGDNI